MEEKKLTEKESLELITLMIENSKKRMELGSGNVLLSWGYVVTTISLIVGCGYYITQNMNWLWLWFAIPGIGYPLHYLLAKKKEQQQLIKTSIDKFMSGIWTGAGIFFLVMMIICFILGLKGYNAWGAMYLLTLPCCGFCTLASGIILQEKSLTIGGFISMVIGGFFIICYICKINIFIYDTFAFALCFVAMMIIPGHIMNHKAKSQC